MSSEQSKALSYASPAWSRNPFVALNQFIVRFSLRFGTKAKEVERFLKFAVVGAIGAVVDFGVLNILQATILHPNEPNVQMKVALATGTAFTVAVTSNFIWNRYWTYPDSRTRSIRRQLVQFFIVNTLGLVFRLWFVKSLFGPMGGSERTCCRASGWPPSQWRTRPSAGWGRISRSSSRCGSSWYGTSSSTGTGPITTWSKGGWQGAF